MVVFLESSFQDHDFGSGKCRTIFFWFLSFKKFIFLVNAQGEQSSNYVSNHVDIVAMLAYRFIKVQKNVQIEMSVQQEFDGHLGFSDLERNWPEYRIVLKL